MLNHVRQHTLISVIVAMGAANGVLNEIKAHSIGRSQVWHSKRNPVAEEVYFNVLLWTHSSPSDSPSAFRPTSLWLSKTQHFNPFLLIAHKASVYTDVCDW